MNYSFELLKRFQPRKINDLSLVNASLRPSGASYRDRLIAKEFNKNPSELIDELLKDNNGFLVFQEDTIAFLQQICGLSGSDADNIRRAIGRKQKDRLDKAMPSILEGYCNKSNNPREIAEQEAKEFLQIIEDSSNYQFGLNHSTGYSMIGYTCGYLRHYYPLEFTTAYLNNAKTDDDINDGTSLIRLYGFKINNPTFRYSQGKYYPDKSTSSIYKGIGSIKFLNTEIGDKLYNLRDKKYDTFIDLLDDINKNKIVNSRQLEILIKINFFREFGKNQRLLKIAEIYNKLNGKSQFKKDKLPLELTHEDIIPFVGKETEKTLSQIDIKSLVKSLISNIPNTPISMKEQAESELEYVGEILLIDEDFDDSVNLVTDIKENKWGTPFVTIYQLNNGNTKTMKVDKKYYLNKPVEKYDMINAVIELRNKKKKVDNKWVVSDEKEEILTYGFIRQ